MSGRILPEIRPLIAEPKRLEGLQIMLVHGESDNVLPVQNGRASRALLESLPVKLEYREYAMRHQITPQSLADVARWLSRRIDEHKGTTASATE